MQEKQTSFVKMKEEKKGKSLTDSSLSNRSSKVKSNSTQKHKRLTRENLLPLNKTKKTVLDILKYDDLTNYTCADNYTLVKPEEFHPLENMTLSTLFIHEESFSSLKSEKSLEELNVESRAPSEFQLSKNDPVMLQDVSDTIQITLNETETYELFELPQKLEDARTVAGENVVKNNERYMKLIGSTIKRHVSDCETQTINVGMKHSSTQLSKTERKNQGTIVNNWIMFDELSKIQKTEKERDRDSEPRISLSFKDTKTDEQLHHIYYKTRFQEATRIILRILASNTFEKPHKLYKGLIQEDITDPNREPTYELELLWTYSDDSVKSRWVSAFAWNHVNIDLLAVGYGPSKSKHTPGLLLIWCAKNPQNPEYTFHCASPVSALDWSTSRPHWIAVGLYNGDVQVIDFSGKVAVVVKESSRLNSPSHERHWSIQWWVNEEDDGTECPYREKEIYAANQDGRIVRYTVTKDFEAEEVTRLKSMNKENECSKQDRKQTVDLFEHTAALLLRRHPTQSTDFFVGTEEGFVCLFSDSHLDLPIDSFLAHNSSVYSLEFSPFCPAIFLTSGADWCTRIWCLGVTEPLITLRTKKSVVKSAVWSPINATIIATIVESDLCIWNLATKTYEPRASMQSPLGKHFQGLKFMPHGKQLIASDVDGNIFFLHLKGMPIPNYDRRNTLINAIEKVVMLNPKLLQTFRDSMRLQ